MAVAALAPAQPARRVPAEQPPQRAGLPPRPLIHGAEASAVEKPHSKHLISEMLVKMHDENHLSEEQWKDATPPASYGNHSLVKYTLELCQYVMAEDEINNF